MQKSCQEMAGVLVHHKLTKQQAKIGNVVSTTSVRVAAVSVVKSRELLNQEGMGRVMNGVAVALVVAKRKLFWSLNVL